MLSYFDYFFVLNFGPQRWNHESSDGFPLSKKKLFLTIHYIK